VDYSGFDLYDFFSKIHLGGKIDECVITRTKKGSKVMAMELEGTVMVHALTPLDFGMDKIGIGSLPLLTKYLKANIESEISITCTPNRLNMKAGEGGKFGYLLSDPDLIPTYDPSWEETVNKKEILAKYEHPVHLTRARIAEFSKFMGMFASTVITISVAKGVVYFSSGSEVQHTFNVKMGNYGGEEFEPVEIYGTTLMAIIRVLNIEEDAPELLLADNEDVCLKAGNALWTLHKIVTED